MSIEQDIADSATGLTVPSVLRTNAERFPDLPALSATDRTLTWSELRAEVAAVTRGLGDLGLGRRDRMLIMMSSRPEHWVADLAATHLAAVPSTTYATLSAEQIDYVAGHSGAKVVVLEGADELRRWTDALRRSTTIEHVVVVDDVEIPDDPRLVRWDTLWRSGARQHEDDPEVFERVWAEIEPSDPVAMLYTSGTTGDPKGVVLSHHNVFYQAAMTDHLVPIPAHARTIGYLPLAHIAERELSIYRALYSALHVTVCPNQAEVMGALTSVHPPVFFGVPRVWEKISAGLQGVLAGQDEPSRGQVENARALALEAYRLRGAGEPVPDEVATSLAEADARVLRPIRAMLGLDALRWGSSGAAPLPFEVLEFLASIGIEILEVWGMTETTACVTVSTPDAFKPGTVGPVAPGMELRIADDGEIFVRGPVVCLGFLEASGEIVPATDGEGWLATGDVGALDEDGFLSITDRKKELIITSTGKNVPPTMIEGLIRAHPLVGQAVAIGDNRPYLTALITLDEDGAPAWARARGISGDIPELAAHPEVRAEIDGVVRAANHKLARAEQVKKYEILPSPWNAESGELTPTLKLRRAIVQDRYARQIEDLYRS